MKTFMQIAVCGGLLLAGCLGATGPAQETTDEVKYYYDDAKITLSQAVEPAGNYDIVYFSLFCLKRSYSYSKTFLIKHHVWRSHKVVF